MKGVFNWNIQKIGSGYWKDVLKKGKISSAPPGPKLLTLILKTEVKEGGEEATVPTTQALLRICRIECYNLVPCRAQRKHRRKALKPPNNFKTTKSKATKES